ncbi:MAG: hypothetical protein NT096_00200 [Proteobacteria bacterium]|nr:hypothetical protein [Pseudomonadota bacterium]
MIENNFHPQVLALKKKIEELRAGLLKHINELPDNPAIKRLGNGCFTMSVSDTFTSLKSGVYKDGQDKRTLMSCWCPEMHDFKRQYQKIATILSSKPLEDMERTLHQIILQEKWDGYKFHPDVIKNLKALWEGE